MVRIEATSEPAPGSVIPSAPIFSPLIPGTSQRCFCSSVPNFQIGGIAISACGAEPCRDAAAGARARELLDAGGVVDVVAALAAVLARELEPEEAELAAAVEQLARELALLLPLVDVRGDLLGDELVDRLAQVLVLLGEGRERRPLAGVLDDVCWLRPPVLEHRVAPALVVEAEQVALRVLLAAVVVGADLGDLAVAHLEPLGAAVQPLLAGLRVAPGHRPLDHGLVALLDPVLEVPLAVDDLDAHLRVLADPLGALVRPQPRVVVDGVLGEVRGDEIGVAGVERLVVGADVVEVEMRLILAYRCRTGGQGRSSLG